VKRKRNADEKKMPTSCLWRVSKLLTSEEPSLKLSIINDQKQIALNLKTAEACEDRLR